MDLQDIAVSPLTTHIQPPSSESDLMDLHASELSSPACLLDLKEEAFGSSERIVKRLDQKVESEASSFTRPRNSTTETSNSAFAQQAKALEQQYYRPLQSRAESYQPINIEKYGRCSSRAEIPKANQEQIHNAEKQVLGEGPNLDQTLQEEARKIFLENQNLTEQIQMWKAVEQLQSRASCGREAEEAKNPEVMTTIFEEDSLVNETFLTNLQSNPRFSVAASQKSFSSIRSVPVSEEPSQEPPAWQQSDIMLCSPKINAQVPVVYMGSQVQQKQIEDSQDDDPDCETSEPRRRWNSPFSGSRRQQSTIRKSRRERSLNVIDQQSISEYNVEEEDKKMIHVLSNGSIRSERIEALEYGRSESQSGDLKDQFSKLRIGSSLRGGVGEMASPTCVLDKTPFESQTSRPTSSLSDATVEKEVVCQAPQVIRQSNPWSKIEVLDSEPVREQFNPLPDAFLKEALPSKGKTRNKKGIQIYKPQSSGESDLFPSGVFSSVPHESAASPLTGASSSVQAMNTSAPAIRSPFYLNKQQQSEPRRGMGYQRRLFDSECSSSQQSSFAESPSMAKKKGPLQKNSKIQPYHSKKPSAPLAGHMRTISAKTASDIQFFAADDSGEPQVIETDSQLSPARNSVIEKAKPYIPHLSLSLIHQEDPDIIPSEQALSDLSGPLTTRSSGVVSVTERPAMSKKMFYSSVSSQKSSSRPSSRRREVKVEMRRKAVISTRKKPVKG